MRFYRKTEENIKKIQIFGERCSGTNYLEALLGRNFPQLAIRWDMGWKHWFCLPEPISAPDCLVVVIYRHPYDWLRSLHRHPHHVPQDRRNLQFSAFIRCEWMSVMDEDAGVGPDDAQWQQELMQDRDPQTGERFANVLAMRNAKIRHWESLKERFENVCYVRLEELRRHPQAFLDTLATEYGLERAAPYVPVSTYKGRNEPYRRQHYLPIGWVNRRYIRQQLDVEQEAAIGYALEASTKAM